MDLWSNFQLYEFGKFYIVIEREMQNIIKLIIVFSSGLVQAK